MEFECEFEKESNECNYYVKPIYNDGAMCIVCMMDETEENIIINNGHHWERYIIKCGHKIHTRCFRRWCFSKNRVNRPYCGNVKNTFKIFNFLLVLM
jgi:hypothetical protein